MFWVAVIALAGITWLAYQGYLDHRQQMARLSGTGTGADELARRVDAVEAERARLRQRVENLEAIVTSEGFDLNREATRAGLPAAPLAGMLDDEPTADEEEVARRAQRLRG